MENTVGKPTVKICSWCQDQFPDVKMSVYKHKNEYNFSHGICKRHAIQWAKPLGPEKVQKIASEHSDDLDLQLHPELKQAYSIGNFLPQQSPLKERLQKLANIKKNYI